MLRTRRRLDGKGWDIITQISLNTDVCISLLYEVGWSVICLCIWCCVVRLDPSDRPHHFYLPKVYTPCILNGWAELKLAIVSFQSSRFHPCRYSFRKRFNCQLLTGSIRCSTSNNQSLASFTLYRHPLLAMLFASILTTLSGTDMHFTRSIKQKRTIRPIPIKEMDAGLCESKSYECEQGIQGWEHKHP